MTDREIFEKETGIDISEWIQPDNVYCIDNEYIKNLYQYIDWLEKRSEWVSVEDRLPELPCFAEWDDGEYTYIDKGSKDFISSIVKGVYQGSRNPVKVIRWTHAPPDEVKGGRV